jgi:hypothetical protein
MEQNCKAVHTISLPGIIIVEVECAKDYDGSRLQEPLITLGKSGES